MKVVINKCYGGFSLSPEAELKLYERGMTEIATPVDEVWPPDSKDADKPFGRNGRYGLHEKLNEWREYLAAPGEKSTLFLTTFTPDEKFILGAREVARDNPLLVALVEEMGEKSWGRCAELKIVEIPDGIDYVIEEYDGMEWVAETHRTWS